MKQPLSQREASLDVSQPFGFIREKTANNAIQNWLNQAN